MAFKTFRKIASKAKKIVRKGARAYLKLRRSKYVKPYSKTGMVSTTAVAKTLSNLRQRVNNLHEYKVKDNQHTFGDADVALRQFYQISASAAQATAGTTTTPGITGYGLFEIILPTRGDGVDNFDGKRYTITSIQWKGTLHYNNADSQIKMMIIKYSDEDMDNFSMDELLIRDNNTEFSIASKRNFDYKNYKVLASRTYSLTNGSNRRRDFNIFVKMNSRVRHFQTDDQVKTSRYYCVLLGSSDLAGNSPNVQYQGNTRMRFIA